MAFNGTPVSQLTEWPDQSLYFEDRKQYPRCRTREDYIRKFQLLTRKTEGCWLWLGTTNRRNSKGKHGLFQFDTHMFGIPSKSKTSPWPIGRFAWLIHHGIDPGDLLVCHTCDNGMCCNPAHLFLGTPSDNMQDMLDKGRAAWQNPNHPISRRQFRRLNFSISTGKRYVVQEIRRIYVEEGWSIAALGRRFGYEQSSIFRMLEGRYGLPPIETDKHNRTVTV